MKFRGRQLLKLWTSLPLLLFICLQLQVILVLSKPAAGPPVGNSTGSKLEPANPVEGRNSSGSYDYCCGPQPSNINSNSNSNSNNQQSSSSGGINITVVGIAGGGGGCVFVIVCIIGCYYLSKRKK